MKKAIVLITLLLIWVLLLSQPNLEFETLVYDFGRIKEEAGPYNVDFKFSNTGDESFHLIKVKAGWGCTAPSWSTDEIKSGQTGIISVQFDSNDRPGGFNKPINVYTSINNKIVKLIIKGFVIGTHGKRRSKIGPLDAQANVLDFGNIYHDSVNNEIITIFNSTEDIIHIFPPNKFDHIELSVEPQILESGQSGEIAIQLSTIKSDLGKSVTVCDFEIIKRDEKHRGRLSILANVIENFSLLTAWELANPPIIYTAFETIDIGRIEVNELASKNIEIENRGKRELLIHSIKTTNSMYSINPVKQKIKPGGKGTFQISIKPTIERNNISSKLTIISNDPHQSVIYYTIIGKVDLPEESSSKYLVNDIRIEMAAEMVKNYQENNELLILDVRNEIEYNNGCIEDAINLNYYDSNFKKMIKLMDKQKIYLVYCKSGIRSKKAVELMSGMGFKKIYHMFEGIEGWKDQHLKLIDPNK